MMGFLLAAIIELFGVTGDDLTARAFFDANNVKVGDLLVLTVDFLGEADFKDLHPPKLSRHVDSQDWAIYDESATTDTYRDARRLVYKVRPKREGVVWFPALEFAYEGKDGEQRTVRANAIPVHAKAGKQVEVAEMGEDASKLPDPPSLIVTNVEDVVNEDAAFAWRKACAKPTAKAFAEFDFPAAKMNEATCAINEGKWSEALKIYSRLEWRIGQTEAIEKGIIAALARKYDNPSVELPVWRQVLRPILRFDWKGRVALVLGGFLALALVFWLLGRGIKAVACIAILLASMPAFSQGLFEQMEEQMRQMRQQMNQQMRSSMNFSFGGMGMESQPAVKITATAEMSKPKPQVGENFEFLISLESPKSVTLDQLRFSVSENFGLTTTGRARELENGKSANPSNVVRRLSVPVRYDVPFKGKLTFTIGGMASGTQQRGRKNRSFSFTFSNSFRAETPPLSVEIAPLPNQPANFSGIVADNLRMIELCDILKVETNDIVKCTYRMSIGDGYVPNKFLPDGVAFEESRQIDEDKRPRVIDYMRYFVADGTKRTPTAEVVYYQPRTKKYKTIRVGGTLLNYINDSDEPQEEAKANETH